ncbi:MAG: hypothetical protein K8R74_11480 [Bacteroidales bacterium]|nr:hypothetical protein [Bacteroidales bacterium]
MKIKINIILSVTYVYPSFLFLLVAVKIVPNLRMKYHWMEEVAVLSLTVINHYRVVCIKFMRLMQMAVETQN